jgi:hypothetical protein
VNLLVLATLQIVNNTSLEAPAKWVRHEAGGVVRFAPAGMQQPYGVIFLPPEQDLDAEDWLQATTAEISPDVNDLGHLQCAGLRQALPLCREFRDFATASYLIAFPTTTDASHVVHIQPIVISVPEEREPFMTTVKALLSSVKAVTVQPKVELIHPGGPLRAPLAAAGLGVREVTTPRIVGDWKFEVKNSHRGTLQIYVSGWYSWTDVASDYSEAHFERGLWRMEGSTLHLVPDAAEHFRNGKLVDNALAPRAWRPTITQSVKGKGVRMDLQRENDTIKLSKFGE